MRRSPAVLLATLAILSWSDPARCDRRAASAADALGSGARIAAPQISADEAAALAVLRLEPTATGLRLEHPRRTVEFTADGLALRGRRGAPDWRWRFLGASTTTGASIVAAHPVRPVEDQALRVEFARGPIVEEYLLGLRAIEQRFRIPEPLPLGEGDLVVAGEIRSDGDFAERDGGWIWSNGRGEVTLGGATVFDAAGRTLPCRFEVTAERTRLVVDGAALADASYPVTIDPEVGANDYRISDMGPNGDAAYDAFDVAVAYNSRDNMYVVVWAGDTDTGGLVDEEYEIFGQILSASGTQFGSNDKRLSFAGGTGDAATRAFRPAIAYNSEYNEYLVVWSADNPANGCVDNEFEIWGQVLDADLDPPFGGNFRISFNGGTGDPAFDADNPAVTYNPDSDEYLVVWDGDHNAGGLVDNESEIWAQRVYSTGILVGSNLRMSDMGGTGDANYDAFAPDVAYNTRDHEYLIVWYGDDNTGGLVDDENEIFGQRIDQTGGGLGTNDARLSDAGGTGDAAYDAFDPAVAYNPDDNEYLVVWLGDDNVGGVVDGEFEVFSQRLDAALGGLGANDFRLSDAGGLGNASYDVSWGPNVAFNPSSHFYMVTWAGEDTVDGMVDGEVEVFTQMLTASIGGVGPNDERISDLGGLGSTQCGAETPVVAANTWTGEFLVAWDGDDTEVPLVPGEREAFVQRMDGPEIFLDIFESGTTYLWSLVAP